MSTPDQAAIKGPQPQEQKQLAKAKSSMWFGIVANAVLLIGHILFGSVTVLLVLIAMPLAILALMRGIGAATSSGRGFAITGVIAGLLAIAQLFIP